MTDAADGQRQSIETKDLTPSTTNLFPRAFKAMPSVVRGDGAYLYDAMGNKFFDAVAGNQCSNIGHGVSAIADAAADQLRSLEYASSVLFVNPQSERYAEQLADFLPDEFAHSWFVSGGSEANESAIKLAREYHRITGNPEKHVTIGRELSFHGNTLGTLGVGGVASRREPYVPMLDSAPKAPPAYPYRCRYCDSETDCRTHGEQCARELERRIQEVGPEYVSAFIAEPIVGAANAAAVPGDAYFRTVRDICDAHDVLLIVDEVMTGMGRTGTNFAIQHWDVTPDIITSAKGLSAGYSPLGAMFPRRRLVEPFADKPDGFTHGHTYSFNPTSAAVGRAVLEYYREHDVVPNARRVGDYAQTRIQDLLDFEFVGRVRGKGLMLGVEFVEDRESKAPLEAGGPRFRDALFHTALERGITVYPGGGSVDGTRGDHVLLTPPLTISEEHVDVMVDRLYRTLEDLEREYLA